MHGRLLLAPLAVAAVATGVAASPAAARTVTVTDQDSGDQVTVRPGDRIRIELDANPSTGYHWEITRTPKRRVARVVSSTYVADPVDPGVVGSGGTQVTVLKARHRGRTMLGMQYQPPGSGGSGSDFDLWIRVRVR
ncbi:MAG TPA: protease inhibitor I42 family protein [Capillimicrobium sp.]|nr:protease inhibitor I42 family protein [Capillimicrobium sp.]